MLFFAVWLLHYCEFKAEHASHNQSFSQPSFDHYHTPPGVLNCANITYFISTSVNRFSRFNAASKYENITEGSPYIFPSDVS